MGSLFLCLAVILAVGVWCAHPTVTQMNGPKLLEDTEISEQSSWGSIQFHLTAKPRISFHVFLFDHATPITLKKKNNKHLGANGRSKSGFSVGEGWCGFSVILESPSREAQVTLVVKNLPVNTGDMRVSGSVPEWERSLGGGHGNPLQYSCLENLMDRGAWWATVHGVTKSWT